VVEVPPVRPYLEPDDVPDPEVADPLLPPREPPVPDPAVELPDPVRLYLDTEDEVPDPEVVDPPPEDFVRPVKPELDDDPPAVDREPPVEPEVLLYLDTPLVPPPAPIREVPLVDPEALLYLEAPEVEVRLLKLGPCCFGPTPDIPLGLLANPARGANAPLLCCSDW
jgi:hypothetical protein